MKHSCLTNIQEYENQQIADQSNNKALITRHLSLVTFFRMKQSCILCTREDENKEIASQTRNNKAFNL